MERTVYYNSLDIYADFLDNIFKFYPEGIVCKNSDLKCIYFNNSYRKIFPANDSKNQVCDCILSEQNQKLVNDADNLVRQNLYPMNYIINTNDNKILSITSSPIVKENSFIGIISCVRDITQEEHLKESFVNRHFRRISAEKNLQAQRETFVASVGHDLKNPTLAQIRGLELLLRGAFGNLNKEQYDILEMILDSCRYMNGMLSSLLETYRNYGGAVKLSFAEFSLTELVNECISEMVYVAKDKSLNIITNISGENCICADRIQIKRVIMNLLSNAIKYAYKNTDLKLSVHKLFNGISFEFENKSPYIPEKKRKSIFAKYVSYAGVHKELGIGLGLYASKKIIESHNGNLYVKSFKDERNIFGFSIPQKQQTEHIQEVYL